MPDTTTQPQQIQAPDHLNGFSVLNAHQSGYFNPNANYFGQQAGNLANSFVNSPVVQSGLNASAAISKNVAQPGFNALKSSVQPVVNTLLNPGSQVVTPALKSLGVPASIAGVAGVLGDVLSPGGKASEASKLERSVVQIVNSVTGDKAFLKIPAGQLPVYHSLIDDTSRGIAGKTNQYGDIYHLTAKTPEQMTAQGFADLGIADHTMIPRMVEAHERPGTQGVQAYMKYIK